MRVIETEGGDRSTRWALWLTAGALLGLTAGVLAAERFSGRRPSPRTLWRRARSLARIAAAQWGPVVDLAFDLRDAWAERRATVDDTTEGEDVDDGDDVDEFDDRDGDEYDPDLDEDADLEDAAVDARDDPPDKDDEDADEDDEDDEDDADDEDGHSGDPIGRRVLEAFRHDPVLAERAIEIDADELGTVRLHGRVRTAREVAHAVTIARGVPGVTDVRQRLTVRPRR